MSDVATIFRARISSAPIYSNIANVPLKELKVAADEIERLRAENGRLRAVNEGRAAGNHLAALQALREHEGEAG